MNGEIVLLECDPLGAAVEALQSAPDVMDAAVFGNALHLVVKDAASALPQLTSYLAEHNISVTRMEEIRPSLEDVFVSLTTSRKAAEERKP
jgi:ABC-2 type transport system ATP-binding protein